MQSERMYKLTEYLRAHPGSTLYDIMDTLEVSRATAVRDIAALRDRFDTPIKYDRFTGGYSLEEVVRDNSRRAVKRAELPGLWFDAEEALGLLTAQELLSTIEPAMLGPKLKPLADKLTHLVEASGHSMDKVKSRIRITQAGKRKLVLEAYREVASATLDGKRLSFSHYNRQTGERMQREVSPQRLVHYRENWYLDAWCHTRNALRCFSVDAMSKCVKLDADAIEVPEEDLNAELGTNYGIFGGKRKDWAVLRFTPERARWVSREVWHPEQQTKEEKDGSYVLEVPYADERELIGDILKHGAGVEVLGPKSLRSAVQKALLAGVGRYV